VQHPPNRSTLDFVTQEIPMRPFRTLAVALFATLLATACAKEDSGAASSTPPGGAAGTGYFATASLSQGGGLPGIGEVKRTATTGDSVRFVARVGGRAACFVPSAAVMIVADPVLEDCIQKGDGCPKPWDYCCEPRERIKANTATVRFVDASGLPLADSMEGMGGLAPLKTVEIVGTVAETGPEGLFVVDAERIFVVPG
jgi:hypothetical protein